MRWVRSKQLLTSVGVCLISEMKLAILRQSASVEAAEDMTPAEIEIGSMSGFVGKGPGNRKIWWKNT